MRTHLVLFFGGLLAIAAVPAELYACSASSSIGIAKGIRGTADYLVARDVAIEMIDEEGYLELEPTIEAGIGILVHYAGITATMSAAEIDDELDSAPVGSPGSVGTHGMTSDGTIFASTSGVQWAASYGRSTLGRKATHREHVRLHLWETDQALRGVPIRDLSSVNLNSYLKNTYGDEKLAPAVARGG